MFGPASTTVTSRSGARRLAFVAQLMPAAFPPTTRRLVIAPASPPRSLNATACRPHWIQSPRAMEPGDDRRNQGPTAPRRERQGPDQDPFGTSLPLLGTLFLPW